MHKTKEEVSSELKGTIYEAIEIVTRITSKYNLKREIKINPQEVNILISNFEKNNISELNSANFEKIVDEFKKVIKNKKEDFEIKEKSYENFQKNMILSILYTLILKNLNQKTIAKKKKDILNYISHDEILKYIANGKLNLDSFLEDLSKKSKIDKEFLKLTSEEKRSITKQLKEISETKDYETIIEELSQKEAIVIVINENFQRYRIKEILDSNSLADFGEELNTFKTKIKNKSISNNLEGFCEKIQNTSQHLLDKIKNGNNFNEIQDFEKELKDLKDISFEEPKQPKIDYRASKQEKESESSETQLDAKKPNKNLKFIFIGLAALIVIFISVFGYSQKNKNDRLKIERAKQLEEEKKNKIEFELKIKREEEEKKRLEADKQAKIEKEKQEAVEKMRLQEELKKKEAELEVQKQLEAKRKLEEELRKRESELAEKERVLKEKERQQTDVKATAKIAPQTVAKKPVSSIKEVSQGFLSGVISNRVLSLTGVDLTKIDLNYANTDGITPLIGAINNNNVELVKELVSSGANVNKGDVYRTSPLMYSTYKGNLQIIETLLINGASKTTKDEFGENAYDRAHKNRRVIELLNKY